jgi:Na+-driven multidrug efflux pump
VAGVLVIVDTVADLIWAGRIGVHAIAGLGVGQTYIMLVMTARLGLDAGMRAMIARAVGARMLSYANHVLLQSFTVALNTSGSTVAPMIVTLAIMWTIDLPLAYALSRATPLGEFGVPGAMVPGSTLRLALYAWYFGRGRWPRTGVI